MSHKILTVDDSRTIRMIVKNAFKAYDCELFEAENGRDGLALAQELNPDLIILDITMPVMTGIEMLTELMQIEALKNIAVIMLTAESGRDIVMNIVKMGAKDYVVKPFKGDQLIERVKLLLDLKPRIDDPSDQGQGKKNGLFTTEGDLVILHLPPQIKRAVITEVETALNDKISQMNAADARKFLLDISAVDNLSMAAIQLIISVINSCARAKLMLRMVAQANQIESMQGFKETSVVRIKTTIEEAKADF